MKLLSTVAQRKADRQAQLYRDLIHREAKIGGELFGGIQPGHRREFFCLDRHTWVWHEEWVDQRTGERQIVTTRYDIRPNGILKAQDGQGYRYIDKNESRNFYQAVELYYRRVSSEIYGLAV